MWLGLISNRITHDVVIMLTIKICELCLLYYSFAVTESDLLQDLNDIVSLQRVTQCTYYMSIINNNLWFFDEIEVINSIIPHCIIWPGYTEAIAEIHANKSARQVFCALNNILCFHSKTRNHMCEEH